MQNIPPLPLYQFFWNWNKCFNSKKLAALRREASCDMVVVSGYRLNKCGLWPFARVFHSSLASLVLHLTTESFSFKFDLELSTPGPCLWRRNKNGCRKHTFAVHAANVNGKKTQQLTFINQMCQKGPRKIYSCRYIFPFGDSQSKQTKREKQMTNNNNNKTPVH